METANSITKFITEINNELYDQTENDEVYLVFKSIGQIFHIEFMGICIWDSEHDERIEIYEDIYEQLEPFIRTRCNSLVRDLVNIQL